MAAKKAKKVTAKKLTSFKSGYNTSASLKSKNFHNPYPGLTDDHTDRNIPSGHRIEKKVNLNKKTVHPSLVRIDYKTIANPKSVPSIFGKKTKKKK